MRMSIVVQRPKYVMLSTLLFLVFMGLVSLSFVPVVLSYTGPQVGQANHGTSTPAVVNRAPAAAPVVSRTADAAGWAFESAVHSDGGYAVVPNVAAEHDPESGASTTGVIWSAAK